MTTVRDIVTRAYRKIGVGGHGEDLEAAEMADGVEALNAMIFGWKLAGVDTEHTAVTPSDTFPLDAEYEEGTVYLLADRLSPDYEMPARFDADAWFRRFQAAYFTATDVTLDDAVIKASSYYRLS